MASFEAPSGAKVEVTVTDYSTCFDLMKAVLRAVRQGGVGSKIPDNIQMSDLGKFSELDIKDLGGFADAVIGVMTSKEVEELTYKCMERATYNGQRITRSTFEPEESRGDFLFVAFQVIKTNLNPFGSHLSSGLKGMFPGGTNSSPSSK
mgnify:CR=1 FL=1